MFYINSKIVINMNNKKVIVLVLAMVYLAGAFAVFASAHSDEDFAAAEDIISKKISCDELNDSQLEMLGDYYMEQIHPGEAHEQMDEMMGGEGSESLKQMHIAMAYRFYCNDGDYSGSGMMGSNGYGMMGSGMMGGYNSPAYSGYGMMGNYYNGFNWFFVFSLLVIAALIAVIILLIIKLKDKDKGRKRK